jgi:hypothetical protein
VSPDTASLELADTLQVYAGIGIGIGVMFGAADASGRTPREVGQNILFYSGVFGAIGTVVALLNYVGALISGL